MWKHLFYVPTTNQGEGGSVTIPPYQFVTKTQFLTTILASWPTLNPKSKSKSTDPQSYQRFLCHNNVVCTVQSIEEGLQPEFGVNLRDYSTKSFSTHLIS